MNVARNAEVLDQTFSEHFKTPVIEGGDGGYGGGGGGSGYGGGGGGGYGDSSSRPVPDGGQRRSSNEPRPAENTPFPSPYSANQSPPGRRRRSKPYQNTPSTGFEPEQRSRGPSSRTTPQSGSNHNAAGASSGAAPRCQEHGLECVEREVSREGPNKGRFFFACPLPQGEQCDHFAWADAVAVLVKCPGHDEPCNERVVKKEGPNTGRTFYSCRRDQTETCGFFQWKDEISDAGGSSSSSFGGAGGRGPPSAAGDPNAPKCPGHQAPCVLRVTRKPGDNLGREFYVCSNSESCGFFQWKDELPQSQTTTAARGRRTLQQYQPPLSASTSGYDNLNATGEAPKCGCGLVSTLLTCRNGPNAGRTFYKCPQQPKEQQCGFFEWIT